MKHAMLSACAFVFATIVASAQTPTSTPRPPAPAPTPSTPTMSKSKADDKSVTVTGCLKAWDSSMGAAPASTTGSASTFVLTNVEGDAAKHDTAMTVASQYLVTADAALNLAPHLNHKVRIMGKTMPAVTASSGASPDTSAPGHAMGGMAKDWASLHATSLTMVSATCPAQSQ